MKKFQFIIRIFLIILCFWLFGCSNIYITNQLKYPLPKKGITVKEDRIYHNDKLFAELRYFHLNGKQKNFHEIKKSGVRGLAIYYYSHKKEVWISPEEGWSVTDGKNEFHSSKDVQRIWNDYLSKVKISNTPTYPLRLGGSGPTKERIITTGAFEIDISPDGKIVYYKKPGVLFNSRYKYYIELGVSN